MTKQRIVLRASFYYLLFNDALRSTIELTIATQWRTERARAVLTLESSQIFNYPGEYLLLIYFALLRYIVDVFVVDMWLVVDAFVVSIF